MCLEPLILRFPLLTSDWYNMKNMSSVLILSWHLVTVLFNQLIRITNFCSSNHTKFETFWANIWKFIFEMDNSLEKGQHSEIPLNFGSGRWHHIISMFSFSSVAWRAATGGWCEICKQEVNQEFNYLWNGYQEKSNQAKNHVSSLNLLVKKPPIERSGEIELVQFLV